MRGSLDLEYTPKTNRGGGTPGESPDKLVRPAQKLAKSLIEISSKVQELLTYDETINDLVQENRWTKAIDEELWNLD